MLLEMVFIITNVALLHVETVSLRNVALWYSMCSRKTLSNIYHTKCALAKHCHIFTTPNTVKMCWNSFSPECGVVHFESHTGCISLEWHTTLSLLRWPRQACDFSKLVLFPHISQEFLLLPFSSGWDASQVSEKQKQRCPSRSRFGADCSGISGSPCYHCNFGFIFPGQLKYHMKRVATKEKVVGLFMSCLVWAWRCRALMWVFISIQIWSCNYIFTKWCNYIFTRWYGM